MPEIYTKKIYIDTNVFVNYLFKKDALSTTYLKKIEKGDAQGVTSILTIMETYTSGRKILAQKTDLPLDQIDSIVKDSLKFFYSMKNLVIIPNNEFDLKISDVLSDGFKYISKYKGKIRILQGKKDYKALYSPDALHLSMAIRYGCDEFLTADRDFDATKEVIFINNILN